MAPKLSRAEALAAFEEAFLKGKYDGPRQGIVALAGKPSVGKTLFTIHWPFTPTLVIDCEFSARGFAQPPHAKRNGYGTRWDRLEVKKFGGPGGFDLERQAIPDGKYKTITIDPVDKLWEWATLLARRKVGGPTGEVPQAKTGQMWGEAKKCLHDWLMELSGKADWLFLISHMHIQWPPPPPPAKPTWYSKAGAVVIELADLMLTLERDKTGFNPPSAYISQLEDGKTRYPAIPPRIPVFTPLSLLYYMQADQSDVDLTDPELLPRPVDDGMALLERQVELAERMQKALANPEDEALPEGTLD